MIIEWAQNAYVLQLAKEICLQLVRFFKFALY